MSYEGIGNESFSSFKKRFYNRIGDGSMFDCGDINLLKVVLDGLKINYVSRGRYRNDLMLSPWKDRLFRFAKSMAGKRELPVHKNRILIFGSARVVKDDSAKNVAVYFERIFREFGREKFTYVTEGPSVVSEKAGADLNLDDLIRNFGRRKLNSEAGKLRSALKKWFSTFREDPRFDEKEKENVAYALDRFFREYCAWKEFLTESDPRVVIITCHYHREGFIHASRSLGIKVVELQHGLIAPEDIFYVMPEQVSGILDKALFPDVVIVYGEFWKQRLLKGAESRNEQIITGGYYLFEETSGRSLPESVLGFAGKRKVILITSQYSMHEYYLTYAENLSGSIPEDWCIILKPHPGEEASLFSSLSTKKNVLVSTEDLAGLMRLAQVHISVFSTTLFDAVRFGLPSYALDIPQFSDYVETMVHDRIALRLKPGDNVIARFSNDAWSGLINREDCYAAFDPELFRHIFFGTGNDVTDKKQPATV